MTLVSTSRRLLALGALTATLLGCSAPGASPSSSAGTASAGQSPSADPYAACPTGQPEALAAGERRIVTIETEMGTIEITVEADSSPIAAGNFVALAGCGFYDGVVFHRVVTDFVIQGGDGQYGRQSSLDPARVGTGGPGYTIQDEPVTETYSRGTVAMARSAQPNSVGSQFFIVLEDAARQALADPRYNNYQIIGTVTSGMEVADAIADAADAENPTDPVAMTKVTVAEG